MKNKIVFLLFIAIYVLMTVPVSAQPTTRAITGDDLLGHWYMERMTIRIYKEANGKYFGKIVHLENQDNFRNLTPDTALILRDFSYTEEGFWDKGTVFVTFINQHLKCEIKMIDKDTLKMTARKGFISKTKEWTRVNNYTSR